MFEVKSYESFNELIIDTKLWLEQNYQKFPLDFRVYEEDSEADWDNGESVEKVIKYIEEAKSFNFGESEKFVVARRKPNEKFSDEDVLIFAMLKSPRKKIEKFMEKIQSDGEDFIFERSCCILIFDGRNSVMGQIEFILEDKYRSNYKKEQEVKFSSLKQDKKNELYKIYEKDCNEFGENIFTYDDDYENSKSFANFIKNMMEI